MRKLMRLKLEMVCRAWVELLEELVERQGVVVKDTERARRAVEEFLSLREVVAARWGVGSVLEEFRGSRGHGD